MPYIISTLTKADITPRFGFTSGYSSCQWSTSNVIETQRHRHIRLIILSHTFGWIITFFLEHVPILFHADGMITDRYVYRKVSLRIGSSQPSFMHDTLSVNEDIDTFHGKKIGTCQIGRITIHHIAFNFKRGFIGEVNVVDNRGIIGTNKYRPFRGSEYMHAFDGNNGVSGSLTFIRDTAHLIISLFIRNTTEPKLIFGRCHIRAGHIVQCALILIILVCILIRRVVKITFKILVHTPISTQSRFFSWKCTAIITHNFPLSQCYVPKPYFIDPS